MLKDTLLNPEFLDSAAERLSHLLPPGAEKFHNDLSARIRATLPKLLADMNLVTREEFDVQCKVLARTREKVQALEQRLNELEQNRENS